MFWKTTKNISFYIIRNIFKLKEIFEKIDIEFERRKKVKVINVVCFPIHL